MVATTSLVVMVADVMIATTAVAGFGLFFLFLAFVTNPYSVGNAKAFPILFLHINIKNKKEYFFEK